MNNPPWYEAVRDPLEKLWPISPDGTRLAAYKGVGGQTHAGWIDSSGKFTDVNAGESQAAFEGNTGFGAIGFDKTGLFYYTKSSGDLNSFDVFAADPNNLASERRIIARSNGKENGPFGRNGRLTINRETGEISFPKDAPGSDVYSRAGADYLRLSGHEQIERCSDMHCSDGVKLLPTTNTNSVLDPVPDPTLSKVAFKLYSRTSSAGQLYTVGINGGEAPVPIPITITDLSKFNLVSWN